MILGNIEQINFGARLRILPFLVVSPFFIFFAFMSYLEIKQFLEGEIFSFDILWALPLVVAFFLFVVTFSTLSKGLRFTEAGIHRRTILPPHFIAWGSIEAAQVTRTPYNIFLELRVSRWRWIIVPLGDFKQSVLLLSEIRKRLPFEIHVSEKELAMLNKSDN